MVIDHSFVLPHAFAQDLHAVEPARGEVKVLSYLRVSFLVSPF